MCEQIKVASDAGVFAAYLARPDVVKAPRSWCNTKCSVSTPTANQTRDGSPDFLKRSNARSSRRNPRARAYFPYPKRESWMKIAGHLQH